jgi:hypothetical protein
MNFNENENFITKIIEKRLKWEVYEFEWCSAVKHLNKWTNIILKYNLQEIDLEHINKKFKIEINDDGIFFNKNEK